jgi:5'(3')-deoxyribonucleotidase
MAKPRLAVDMDEVVADAFGAIWRWYRERHGYDWSAAMLEGRRFEELAEPTHVQQMEDLLQQGEVFGSFDVMPGSQRALEQLSSTYDVFIATAAMEYPASCAAKFRWLRAHFPFIRPLNIVFCGDKSILDVEFLLDDNVRHFDRLSGQGVLFSAPHNASAVWSPRVSGWDEALTFFQARSEPGRSR